VIFYLKIQIWNYIVMMIKRLFVVAMVLLNLIYF